MAGEAVRPSPPPTRRRAAQDTERYESWIKVSDEELAAVQLTPHTFHGDWNYTAAAPDDGAADVLAGGAGRDWFWSWASDQLVDRAANERVR